MLTAAIESLRVRMSAQHAVSPFGSVDAVGDAVTVSVTVEVTVDGVALADAVPELFGDELVVLLADVLMVLLGCGV